MPDKPVKTSLLLKKNDSDLGKLCQHAAFLADIEKKLLAFLDPSLGSHCKVANYTNDTIILYSDSPAWATRLRYNTPAILDHLRTSCHLDSLKTVRIKVNPPDNSKHLPATKQLFLSVASAEFISQVANSMTDNDLRQSLLKIAKHKKT